MVPVDHSLVSRLSELMLVHIQAPTSELHDDRMHLV